MRRVYMSAIFPCISWGQKEPTGQHAGTLLTGRDEEPGQKEEMRLLRTTEMGTALGDEAKELPLVC